MKIHYKNTLGSAACTDVLTRKHYVLTSEKTEVTCLACQKTFPTPLELAWRKYLDGEILSPTSFDNTWSAFQAGWDAAKEDL